MHRKNKVSFAPPNPMSTAMGVVVPGERMPPFQEPECYGPRILELKDSILCFKILELS